MGRRLFYVSMISLGLCGTACGVSDTGEDVATASSALVNEVVELTGPVHSTGISGNGGWFHVLGNPLDDDFALWGLWSKERTNEPCWVQVNTESINFALAKGVVAKDLCGAAAPNEPSLLTADFADHDFTGERAFVSGVQVCMNQDDTRVKGWRLYGKTISASGQLVDIANYALAGPRANCSAWQAQAHCPAGELATAAEVHFDNSSEPRSWIGISLRCRAVTVVP
jgi:hypothetical protein